MQVLFHNDVNLFTRIALLVLCPPLFAGRNKQKPIYAQYNLPHVLQHYKHIFVLFNLITSYSLISPFQFKVENSIIA